MDLKFKIIIMLFIVIAFLYTIYYIVSGITPKKETFLDIGKNDDIENYQDPVNTPLKIEPPKIIPPKQEIKVPTPPPKPEIRVPVPPPKLVNPEKINESSTESNKRDLRILILDDIEKLAIHDKNVKGQLMESLFSDEKLQILTSMKEEERFNYIKKEYNKIKNNTVSSEVQKTEDENDNQKNEFENDTNISQKTEEIINQLQIALDGIKSIKQSAYTKMTKTEPKSTYKDEVPTAPKEPTIPPLMEEFWQKQFKIEGFENNMQKYASPF